MKALLPLLALAAGPALAGHELDGRDLTRGAALYATHCAACHGAALEGAEDWQTPDENGIYPAPPHDETGHTWHHSNVQNFNYVQQGGQAIVEQLGLKGFTSGMPGFAEVLSDEEIWQVLAYIRSSWPDRIQDLHAARNPPHD
ncbi:c-type cytochrome [Maliponia aquimaris]|uniref:Cytochrome c6 n=1 Tax=Maliponia aquimaris TaxID=1673631 RepID=A0A238KH57_9RHOB|nr:cytochrome c [Maliponia aquimaris]SMX42111.1 Cytochrome c6 [Maliponia aquimaris]